MSSSREKFLKRMNLDRDIVGRAIEGGVVGSLAFLIGQHLTHAVEGPGAIIGAIWSAIAGLVVLQAGRHDILKFSALQAVGTFMGALISGLYLLMLPPSIWGLALCTFLTAVACYAVRIPDQARLASAAAVVIMGISILSKRTSPLENAALRFIESVIGLALAIAVCFAFDGVKRLLATFR
ncbi:MAG: FUSC family protein [Gammaproteobacteria bacterium]